jgi:hypothetical protein
MRDGEEGITDEDDVVEVAVVEEDDELIKVIPVLDSTPPRQAYKQMARIWISPRGQPTGTLAPRMSARESNLDSPDIGSAVWPPPPPRGRPTRTLAPRTSAMEAGPDSPKTGSAVWPPPPSPSGPVTTAPPQPSSDAPSTTPPPQVNNHHYGAPSRAESSAASPTSWNWVTRVVDRGLGIFLTGLEGHGGRGEAGSGVERRGGERRRCVTPTRWIEAELSKMGTGGDSKESWGTRKEMRSRVWHPRSRLNRIDRILIPSRYTFFLEAQLKRTPGLSVLGPEQF